MLTPVQTAVDLVPMSMKRRQQAEIDRLKEEFFARGGVIEKLGVASRIPSEMQTEQWIETWAAVQILGRQRQYLHNLKAAYLRGEIPEAEMPRNKKEGRALKWWRPDIVRLQEKLRAANGR